MATPTICVFPLFIDKQSRVGQTAPDDGVSTAEACLLFAFDGD